jgi:flavin-dependent dehydrogenase
VKTTIRNPKYKILIAGAGPAGAGLAIRLAKKNFDVCLIERERFPRQKLCGEFISPECFRHFREMGVFEEMFAAGGERISETIFYAPGGKFVNVPSRWFKGSEGGALSLSRAEMDFQLLKKAKSIGVEVLEETSIVGLLFNKENVCGVKIRAEDGGKKEISADLFVDATGRARVLGKMISRRNAKAQSSNIKNSKSEIQNHLVGFKAHLKNVNLEKGACEIYFFNGGYGGLSYVENNLANFCFLIEAEIVKNFSSDAGQIVEQVIFQNTRARKTLKNAAPVHEWMAVAVEGFGKKDLTPAPNLFAVGDAGAFIDPFTGTGMLMALESAELLARAIADNSAIEKIAEQYESAHRRRFQKRLFVCSLMRRAAFAPRLAGFFISALNIGELPRKILARATRPALSASKTD